MDLVADIDLVKAGSLALIAILVLLLFFKDAINDFFRRKLTYRHEAAERCKSLLRQLHGEIELLPNHYFLWLAGGVIYIHGKSLMEREQGRQFMDKSNQEMGRILGFIRAHRLEFPVTIQGLLDELFEAAQVGNLLIEETVELKAMDRKIGEVCEVTKKIAERIRADLE